MSEGMDSNSYGLNLATDPSSYKNGSTIIQTHVDTVSKSACDMLHKGRVGICLWRTHFRLCFVVCCRSSGPWRTWFACIGREIQRIAAEALFCQLVIQATPLKLWKRAPDEAIQLPRPHGLVVKSPKQYLSPTSMCARGA